MELLIDIGNTNTHLGLVRAGKIVRHRNIPTDDWLPRGKTPEAFIKFTGATRITESALCSVVPKATPRLVHAVKHLHDVTPRQLTHRTLRGIGIDYPRPSSIGADRLANALAARHYFGSPVVVVDFGTAVTFDVVNRSGDYTGGIIAPGLAAMTEYLHEKTALLPRIRIREPGRVVGKSTTQAMLSGAVLGYRGLIRELIGELKKELRTRRLPVVATGSYAELIARSLPEIDEVHPLLTLEGLRIHLAA